MITGLLGAFVGLRWRSRSTTSTRAPAASTPMFYAVAAAVIGGTAMLGGSGTILGAFLGAMVLAVLTDGFDVIGVSANVV